MQTSPAFREVARLRAKHEARLAALDTASAPRMVCVDPRPAPTRPEKKDEPAGARGFFRAYTAPAVWERRVASWAESEPRCGFAPAVNVDADALTWEELFSRPPREEALGAQAPAVVTDPALRATIAEDVRSMEALLSQQEWKAAALVGGAVLEAQLVAQLDGREDVAAFAQRQLATSNRKRDDGARWHKPVREWGLYGLVTAALAVGILQAGEADLCHAARKVRNVVHTGARVEPEHALVVYRAVRLVAAADRVQTIGKRPAAVQATA